MLSACQAVPPVHQSVEIDHPDYTTISAENLSQHPDYHVGISASSPEYHVQIGDTLSIQIFGEEDLSGSYFIREDGSITLPLIGMQSIADKTVREIEAGLAAQYSDGYLIDPIVSVSLEKTAPIYILGEVESPGRYDYTPDLKVINAVALAGGYTFRAKKNKMQILRNQNNALERFENLPSETVLKPGDIIVIEERFF